MANAGCFTEGHLNLVSDALFVAEESVCDFYRLSGSAWANYRFELRTLADLSPREVTDRALAQVVRLRQPAHQRRLRARDFYRICLQDHNLLNLVERQEAKGIFLPLLIYVLTHELVHVVRFYQFQHLFDAFEGQRETEEKRVHSLTSEMLGKLKMPKMDQVIDLYQEHGYAL
ncbi:hypothetical protein [Dethiosulfatarculus sandiegensis]|uniref:DUF45 domain-containing protein n=1 Tax=Dethiosulfatarculus sandiegensis TaxID=1429043 RepID=A0A0D2J115_9BACT|nr:hypothetical protein [Dethiosulfatarculus sandiegensis]KIX11924.1 hypothetical protein X474_21580 [Dethiosulfatarculus sandiegensis]